MRTTVEIKGFPELVIKKTIDLGLAKTKNEAIRLGMIVLNKEYNLVNEKNIEKELVIKKLEVKNKEVKSKKIKLIKKNEFYKKYD